MKEHAEEIDCGDERIVRMLYAKLGRPALGKTMAIVGRAAAEEIVQDVFVKLWQARIKFPNLRSAYAWVYKCCTNAAVDFLRSHANQTVALQTDDGKSLPQVELAFATSQPTSDLEKQTEAKQALQILVKELSPEEASLFVYRTFEGLSQDEIAEVMKISRRTVNRILEKLDHKLEKLRRRQHVG